MSCMWIAKAPQGSHSARVPAKAAQRTGLGIWTWWHRSTCVGPSARPPTVFSARHPSGTPCPPPPRGSTPRALEIPTRQTPSANPQPPLSQGQKCARHLRQGPGIPSRRMSLRLVRWTLCLCHTGGGGLRSPCRAVPPTVNNCQPSTTANHQLPTVNNCQPSTTANRQQLPTTNYQPPTRALPGPIFLSGVPLHHQSRRWKRLWAANLFAVDQGWRVPCHTLTPEATASQSNPIQSPPRIPEIPLFPHCGAPRRGAPPMGPVTLYYFCCRT